MVTENSWKSLQLVTEWIKFSDVKAGALLAASGAFGGYLTTNLVDVTRWKLTPMHTAASLLALASVLVSAFLAVRVLNPRLDIGGPPSLLYFRDVAGRHKEDREGFVESYLTLVADDAHLATALAEQVWANNIVASYKFTHVRRSVWALAAGLAFGFVGLLGRAYGL